jgi:hypothetical protein
LNAGAYAMMLVMHLSGPRKVFLAVLAPSALYDI